MPCSGGDARAHTHKHAHTDTHMHTRTFMLLHMWRAIQNALIRHCASSLLPTFFSKKLTAGGEQGRGRRAQEDRADREEEVAGEAGRHCCRWCARQQAGGWQAGG